MECVNAIGWNRNETFELQSDGCISRSDIEIKIRGDAGFYGLALGEIRQAIPNVPS